MVRVVDMHCDTISVLSQRQRQGEEVSILENDLKISLAKMEKGGYGLQNFAMFVHLKKTDTPFLECMQQADTFFQLLRAYPEKIGIVRNWKEIEENWEMKRMSALLTAEEGGICQGEPAFLRILYELGVRMMTLTWNHPNELGFPNGTMHAAEEDNGLPGEKGRVLTRYGLTEKGIAFLEEMERLGMIVDISHLNDDGIDDVFCYTKKPLVASHSNCRAIAPHLRNLTDEHIKMLADRGGVAGLNYYVEFLAQGRTGGERVSGIEDILRHLRHMKKIGGIDVIGLGSDFDGFDNSVEFQDASGMQFLAQAMERDGFTTGEIEKVFYGNVLRVYREILS